MKTCKCAELEKIAETQREILHLQDDLATRMTQFYGCKECDRLYKITKTTHLFNGQKYEFNEYTGSLTSKEIADNAQRCKGDIKANEENSILRSRFDELRNKLRIWRETK